MVKDSRVSRLMVILLAICLLGSSFGAGSSIIFASSPGTFLSDFVSSGSGGLDVPKNLVFGPDGNLYVLSFQNDSIKKYNGATGAFINTFVASGSGGLDGPQGLVFGPDGHLYVASELTDQILRYNGATGAFMGVFVSAGSGGLNNPQELVFDPLGNLYVTSYFSNEVLRYNGLTGLPLGPFVTAGSGGLDTPQGLEFGPDGNLYVVGENTDEVLRYNSLTGIFIGVFASGGGLSTPKDLVFGPDGNLYVTSNSNDKVKRYDGITGAFIDTYVVSGSGGLDSPQGLVFGSDDYLYVTSQNTDEILRYEGPFGISDYCNGKTADEWEALGYTKFVGTPGDDSITGTSGNDVIVSLAGDDTIDAKDGNNIICGGEGDNDIQGGKDKDTIFAGDGNNTIDAKDGENNITTGSGDDDIKGGKDKDTIFAGDGNNTIDAKDGENNITTGSGDDDIQGGKDYDCIASGSGLDTIDPKSGTNLINLGICPAVLVLPTNAVKPILECVQDLGGGTYRAHFGYLNLNSVEITIPIGTDNKFTPLPKDKGQPVIFDVGRTDFYPSAKFSVDFDGTNLVWTLKGPDGNTKTVTASSNPVQRCVENIPSISITSPEDGFTLGKDSEFTFTGVSTDVTDGIISSSIIWSSDVDGPLGVGESITTSLSVGTHVITASVTNDASDSSSISITVTVNAKKDELVMVCHLPPGNPTNYQTLLISSSALQSHLDHGDVDGKCNDKNSDKKVIEQIVKKQREEMDKKNELKDKRTELKEIKKEMKELEKEIKKELKEQEKTGDDKEELKDKVKDLISEIKETLKTLKSDHAYDKEYKEEIKTEFKEIKQKIHNDLTKPEKDAVHSVDSKLSLLSHSDDPSNDAKKLGLKYKDGVTTIAIKLTEDNQKVVQQLSSISNIDVKNDKNVQITINLKDLPKLQKLSGIENIRPPFSAIQFEETVSEGVYFMNADLAQYSGITGKGVKVAVFDLSFTNNPKISENIVEVKSFRSGVSAMPSFWGGDEALHGTAVAEIITDVAPDVELYLYSMETDIEFTVAVDEAISKNIDVIAMSAGWPNFPTDGTSHITKKIEEAVANGIVFVVPAGNFGNKHWEGQFVDSSLNGWHDFSTSDEGLSIEVSESRIEDKEPIIAYMMWDVGQYDIADFELVLVNPLGEIVDFSANKQEKASDKNFEHIYHIPDTEGIYSLGVLYSGDMQSPDNRPKATLEVFTVNDELEYSVPQSSVSVPADAKGAIVVGAVNHLDGELEPYSSQGPTNNGQLAPHVVGPDGVTTLALDGKPFYGTSATTPYVAGLAALMLENNPNLSPNQLLTKMQQNTESSLYSFKNEFDYGTGYGIASAIFLIQDLEVLQ